MIILEPVGGLCNRMRAIASALSVAKALDRRLWLIWRRDSTLNAAFEELFERPLGIDRIITLNSRLAIRGWDVFASFFCDKYEIRLMPHESVRKTSSCFLFLLFYGQTISIIIDLNHYFLKATGTGQECRCGYAKKIIWIKTFH